MKEDINPDGVNWKEGCVLLHVNSKLLVIKMSMPITLQLPGGLCL